MASGKSFNPNENAIGTDGDWTRPEDPRKNEKSGKYPNYWSHKTRSGHNFIMDDSEGAESVTLQHRTGSAIQMTPDGAIHLTAHNSMYTIVFAENRMMVSGAQDITVKGDASFRVYGDHNVTCHKNYNLTVMGDYNVTAKNLNQHIRGNMDTAVKNVNLRAEGTGTYNHGAAVALIGKDAVTLASRTKSAYLVAGKDVNISASGKTGNVNVQSKQAGDINLSTNNGKFAGLFKSGGTTMGVSKGKFGVGSGSKTVSVVADSGKLHTKSTDGQSHQTDGQYNVKASQTVGVQSEMQSVVVKAMQNVQNIATSGNFLARAVAGAAEIRAPAGAATVAGMTTNINALGGILSMAAQGAGINIDSLGGLLNLNGGLASIISAIEQLEFDFGNILESTGIPDITAEKANQPQEEPDLTAEISKWV